MGPAVAAALIAAAIAALGWFVTYVLRRRADLESARREAAVRHLERQLDELYGPLAFLILEGTRVFDDLVQDFGTEWRDGRRMLDADEVEKWLFLVDTHFFPRNEQIEELLSTKAHLIEGNRMPDSFLAFLDHHSSWKLDHLMWKKTGKLERLYSRRRWPARFAEDVLQTFQELKLRHAELLGEQAPEHVPPIPRLRERNEPRLPRRDPRRDPHPADPM